jgi:hypothetical protein
VHGANGFLIDQFLQSGTNRRRDAYGGSVGNRARFALEVVQAAVDVFGAGRVGYKMSPSAKLGGISDENPLATFRYLAGQLNQFGLAYLHVMEALPGHLMAAPSDQPRIAPALRQVFTGPLILNGGYTQETAEQALTHHEADLVSFGVPFIANPDLVARYQQGAPLNQVDPAAFYGGTDHGYIDYPTLRQVGLNRSGKQGSPMLLVFAARRKKLAPLALQATSVRATVHDLPVRCWRNNSQQEQVRKCEIWARYPRSHLFSSVEQSLAFATPTHGGVPERFVASGIRSGEYAPHWPSKQP